MSESSGSGGKPGGLDATVAAPATEKPAAITQRPMPLDPTLATPPAEAITQQPAPLAATLAASIDPASDATVAAEAVTQRPVLDATLAASIDPASDATIAAEGVEAHVALPPLDRKRYRVTGEVGRGGLGRVLRARDTNLERTVAVKELLDPDHGAQARFVREALITSRLQHPSIVPVYDAGTAEDGPFYAMKLVAGRSLAEAIRDATTLDTRLALLPSVIAVADAMAYAHGEKIIHRDLKPGNILVGNFGETVVIDWGLAKDLTSEDAQPAGPYRAAASGTETVVGAVMGTPAYMPPEQAAGDEVDERADVYAIGAVLYHVLCGEPPHSGTTLEEMIAKVVSGEIVPLAKRVPRVPVDLAAIVEKAMAAERGDRYRTAKELAEDLHKFQTGKLVGAHDYSLGERIRRWLRRHKLAVGIAAAAIAVLAVYGGWSVKKIMIARRVAEQQTDRAMTAMADAELQRDAAKMQSLLVRAQTYARTGHTAEEMALLRALASLSPEGERLAIAQGGLMWKAHQRLAMAVGTDPISATWTADGTQMIVSEPHGLVWFDAATGRERGRFDTDSGTRFPDVAQVSPTGRFVLQLVCPDPSKDCGHAMLQYGASTTSASNTLVLDEVATKKRIATFDDVVSSSTLAFAPDDSAIAIQRAETLEVLDAAGTVVRRIPMRECSALAISPGGATVAAVCKGVLKLWRGDVAPVTLPGPTAPVSRLAFIGTDQLLATGGALALWDLTRNELRGVGETPIVQGAIEGGAGATPTGDVLHRLVWHVTNSEGRRMEAPRVMRADRGRQEAMSLLARSPLAIEGGFATTSDDAPWSVLVLRDTILDRVIDTSMLPVRDLGPCAGLAGIERHAMRPLDGGRRFLVDELELPARLVGGRDLDRYRNPSSDDAPVLQIRPARAAESLACLAWGTARGPWLADGGAIPTDANAEAAGRNILVLGTPAIKIAPDGSRTELPTLGPGITSADRAYIASSNATSGSIVEVATGRVIRTWPLEPGARIEWAALDVVEMRSDKVATWIPADAALPVRPADPELEHNRFASRGLKISPGERVIVRVRDGVEVARFASRDASEMLGDDSGRVLLSQDAHDVIVALDGTRTEIPKRAQTQFEPHGDHAVVWFGNDNNERELVVHDLRTGAKLVGPDQATGHVVVVNELWSVLGERTPHLVRTPFNGAAPIDLRLTNPGFTFAKVANELEVSSDGAWIALHGVREGGFPAVAMWSTATGDLLWVGRSSVHLVGNWIVGEGRAFRPSFDPHAVLADTGTRTNFRVCKTTARPVAVMPPPAPDTVWAPDAACKQ